MNYYRKPIDKVANDVKFKMQLGASTLKISENNKKIDSLINVDKNIKKDVSSNTSKIDNNENDISFNLSKITTNEGKISSNSGKISKNEGNISSNSGKISTNEGNISSNLEKINDIENDMKIKNDIYNETFIIPNMSTAWSSKLIFDKTINSKFTTNGIIKINAIYNYSYDINYNFSHVYNFYNYGKKFKRISLKNNIISNVVNDKFDIQGINSTEIKILIYIVNNGDNKSIELFDHNTIQVIYNETTLKSDTNEGNISSNSGRISTYEGDISSNLSKINNNSSDIASNLGKISTNEGNISSNSG